MAYIIPDSLLTFIYSQFPSHICSFCLKGYFERKLEVENKVPVKPIPNVSI